MTENSTNGVSFLTTKRGYFDKKLSGDRTGQRSSRLNRQWRVFYQQSKEGKVEIVTVLEVNAHRY